MLKLKSRGQSVVSEDEFMITNSDDAANLPADSPPGSFAYTADMSYVVQMAEDGTWTPVISETPAETTEENDG